MSGSAVYLDTSAFMKLVMPERESPALRAHLRQWRTRVSAALLWTEALRAAARSSPTRRAAVRRQMEGLVLIDLHRQLLEQAGMLGPPGLRSLDAVHLAAALSLGSDLAELITYDTRMASAAQAQGLTVSQPS